MQLIKIFLTAFLLHGLVFAQQYRPLEEKEVNILSNYYNQDGNHSPVTGGVGTEKLDCIAPMTIVNVPFDTVNDISVTFGIDYYTSASCDKIDKFLSGASSKKYISSASSKDVRGHGDVSYTRKLPKSKSTIGGMLGFSKEFDVTSLAAGFNFSKSSKNENTDFSFKTTLYYDIWKLIYPGEIRGDTLNNKFVRFGNEEEDYDLDNRLTTTFTASLAQVLTKRLQILFTTDFVIQNGILNTPFHRVYFNDGKPEPDSTNWWDKTMRPENLPRHRIKIPIGIRANYYLNDYLTLRIYYRYYWDDFELTSHTFGIELPIKITPALTIYPLYRYYTQQAAKYFKPYNQHEIVRDSLGNPFFEPNADLAMTIINNYVPLETYYTSDYDLSSFINNKYGIGIRISPLYGVAHFKVPTFGYKAKKIIAKPKKTITFKYIDVRYALYNRSDGLKANSISFDCGFVF